MEVDTTNLYKKRYALRRPHPQSKGFEVSIPQLVIERQAAKHNLSVDQFMQQFELECMFNGIDGVMYRFCRKSDGQGGS